MSFLYDFMIEFIAAFLGFFSALFFSGISDKINEKKQKKMILGGIRNELEDIHDAVKEYTDKGRVLKHRIAIPTWDSLQFSGGILSLMENDYYDEIISVYATIKMYNEERSELSDAEAMGELKLVVEHSEKVLALIPKEKRNGKNSKLK